MKHQPDYVIADVYSAHDMYLRRLSHFVPDGLALVHNSVRPVRLLGRNGFRAWLSIPNPEKLEPCPCDWAPELGKHFRVRRSRESQGGSAE